MQTLVHAVVVVGVVVVLPLVLGGPRRWCLVGLVVATSIVLPVGPVAAAVASVWLALAIGTAVQVGTVRDVPRHAVELLATASAPPIVAVGFVLAHPLPQVGGAVLMSAGVLLIAALQLRDAAGGRGVADGRRRVLLALSGLAPWVPMVLAVAWASSLYWDVPALSVPDMARTHGVMNVVFVVAGLLARRGAHTHRERTPAPAPHLHGAQR